MEGKGTRFRQHETRYLRERPLRDRKKTLKEKEMFHGELADTGVIINARKASERVWREQTAFQRGFRDASDKEGLHKKEEEEEEEDGKMSHSTKYWK